MFMTIIAASLSAATLAPSVKAETAGGEVMLLGSYHLANNNRDIINMPIENVLAPERQREIEKMVVGLARWHPTRVAVEWPKDRQAELDQRFAAYLAGAPATANEREQIAFRLARAAGLTHVDAVDWNDDFPGPPESYDFVGWAKAHGQMPRFEAFVAAEQQKMTADAAVLRRTPIDAWYRALNRPKERLAMHRAYFTIASFGDQQNNPGAAWVGGWYARNLRIFNNIRELATPGQRVFVLYGAGHTYLLEQDAIESGAVSLVDPLKYLP